MRWLALSVLGACSFNPGNLGGGTQDGSVSMSSDASVVIDAPVIAIDAPMTDAPPALPGFRRKIDIVDAKVVGGPHTNFPVLVSLTAAWAKSESNGGKVKADTGADLYFSTDVEGAARLAFDLDTYDPVTGTLAAWVKVPSLTATTSFYVQYGDAAVTTSLEDATMAWSNAYELVVHMDGSGDSTGKNATNMGLSLTPVAGQVGNARSFNATTSYATLGSDAPVDNIFAGGGTIEAWFYTNSAGESFGRLFDKTTYAVFIDDTNATKSIGIYHDHSGGNGFAQWTYGDNVASWGAWHHIAVTFNSDNIANVPAVLLDGQATTPAEFDGAVNSFSDDSPSSLYVGNNSGQTRTFDGVIDEVRFSSVIRGPGWLQTEYANQKDPGTFHTIGPEL